MPKLAHASNRDSTPLKIVQSRPLLSSDLVQTHSSQAFNYFTIAGNYGKEIVTHPFFQILQKICKPLKGICVWTDPKEINFFNHWVYVILLVLIPGNANDKETHFKITINFY